MKNHWTSLRVKENTRKLAKELSARADMSLKDYMQYILEQSRNQNVEMFKERKKKKAFDFRF